MRRPGDHSSLRSLLRARAGIALSALLLLSIPSPASAQEESEEIAPVAGERTGRTLAERIPAVTGRFFRKDGRFEISPMLGVSITDPFYQHILLGAAFNFHVFESLSIGASGEAFISILTPVQISGGIQRNRRYNRPAYSARLDVSWAPIYGKLSLMAESVLHFDAYIAASFGVVGPVRSNGPQPAGGGAFGQHYFINEWMAVKLELRVQLWEMERHPRSNPTRVLQTLLSASVGFSFFLPTEFERETL